MKIRHYKFYEGVLQLGDLSFIFYVIPMVLTDWYMDKAPTTSVIGFWIPLFVIGLFLISSIINNRKFKRENAKKLFYYNAQEGTSMMYIVKWDFMFMLGSLLVFVALVVGLNQHWLIEFQFIYYLIFAFVFYAYRDKVVTFREEVPINAIQIFPDKLSIFQHIIQVDFLLSEIASVEVKGDKMLITTYQFKTHSFNLSAYGERTVERFEKRIEEVLDGKIDMQTGDLIISYS